MTKIVVSALFAGGLLIGLLVCQRVGWILGRKRLASEGEDGQSGLGALEGSVYGLMGLLIAFTFSGAASRFDHRRELMTQEVNAIGTAWLRLDLLGDEPRSQMRELFRRYVDLEVASVEEVRDDESLAAAVRQLQKIQSEIWGKAVIEAKSDKSLPLAQVLLPALNEMFDVFQERILAVRQHPPVAVYAMLGLIVLLSGLMVGFGMAKARRQSGVHLIGFSLVMGLAVYFILDLEFPRIGLVTVKTFDRALIELRATMNE